MTSSIKNSYNCAQVLGTRYPQQAGYDPSCSVNVVYDTLPQSFPRDVSRMGPSQVKQLYTGRAADYPPIFFSRPVGTLYDTDTSQYGLGGQRITYGFSAYPFHHQANREVREYAATTLPLPDLTQWTRYETKRDVGF